MAHLSRHVPEPLWEDGDFALSRSTLADEGAPVLVLAPTSERPTPAIIARLEQAYALREQLEPSSVARPLSLENDGGLPALLLEDPGGDLLARLLGQPWEVAQFLHVAVGIAAAVGQLHTQGFIHRDLKPSSILVNLGTGRAWLIGICLASRRARGQVPARPDEIAGALPYMAPEQTGRMNRSIDSRSDLYSLGVIYYELLTGVLPFDATDPGEWVHCHIARQPVSPRVRRKDAPATVSAIIMKLLAKTAEERYQTAAGV
jgi:serine/threonine protein kinase